MTRLIVYGAGAVGGVVAAAAARAGLEVIAIARGRRLEALRNGLVFRTPGFTDTVEVPLAADPAEIDFRPGDMVMLAMKTQDTSAALGRLRAAGWEGPIFCAQNGVTNEDLALRSFDRVHGVLVMMPCNFSELNEATAFSAPRHGVFETGLYPGGADEDDRRFAEYVEAANIGGFVAEDVMAAKRGKLLLNLFNIVQAAVGVGVDAAAIRAALAAEAEAVFEAAGLPWRDVGAADPRRDALMRQETVPGAARMGGSTSQSLARSAGSVETDFINGEVARLGRLHGVPAPGNAYMAALGERLARGGAAVGSIPVETLTTALRSAGAKV